MGEQVKANKPFFVWMNTTRMHVFTHIRPEYHGISGMPGNDYADGMVEHDRDVGKLLKALDDLGITKDTLVIYTTDNGPNMAFSGHLSRKMMARTSHTRTARKRKAIKMRMRASLLQSPRDPHRDQADNLRRAA